MKISKVKPAKTQRADKARDAAPTSKSERAKADPKRDAKLDPRAEQQLLEEVAGTHASPATLQKIVERLLGAGEDSDVKALVKKLSKAARSDTAPPY